jgi:ankyrin repeat protein
MDQLLASIESGDVRRVREAVRLGPDRDDLTEALSPAVEGGNLAIVRTLLEAGADPNFVEESGDETCLMQAVAKGHLPIVRALVGAGADVNAVAEDEEGDDGAITPLLIAVRKQRRAIAEFLLPLTEPQERERVERIRRSVVAPPDRKSAALIRAGESGDLERARALLGEGADVNARDRLGRTALLNAAAYGHARLVGLLLEAGAGPDLKTDEGVTPLMCAPDEEIGSLLVEAGADVNAEQHGFTALMAAAIHGRCPLLRLLIDTGADIEAAEFRGFTPLMLACQHGRREAVAALIGAGADVNRAMASGWTALLEAASKPDAEVVRMLLAAGARTDAEDHQGRTAASLARHRPENLAILESWSGDRGR